MSLIDRQDLFDTLTVKLAEPQSRAGVVKLMAKAALAMVVFQAWPRRGYAQDITDESQLVKGCKLPGQKCNNGKQDCCAKKCKKGAGRCGCINKGKEPLVKTPLGPVPVKALCCSNKLNKRTGECK
jgi:hypothetical protein